MIMNIKGESNSLTNTTACLTPVSAKVVSN